MTCTLIYNPIAGRRPTRRAREIRRVIEVLRGAGMEVEVSPTTGPETAARLASEAAARDTSMVLVCGGDGTINEAINGLVGSYVPLGILPGGTANILARELGVPLDPVRAAQLPRWSARRVPLGRANWVAEKKPASNSHPPPGLMAARYFMTVAGVGYDAHVVYKLSLQMKLAWGVAGYVVEALRQAFRYPFPTFSWSADDGPEQTASFAAAQRARRLPGDGFTSHPKHVSSMTASPCASSRVPTAPATFSTRPWFCSGSTSGSATWNWSGRTSFAAPPATATPSASNSMVSWWGRSRQHLRSSPTH